MSRARDFADLAGSADAGGLTGRNLIINGAMQVAQRGGSATTVSSSTETFSVDRFFGRGVGSAGVFTVEQSTTSPEGFSNSSKVTVTTADSSIGATNAYQFTQRIEGQNSYWLDWGNSSAKTATLSFYVRSSLTGTFGGCIRNSAFNRFHPFSYTISSADTWERKTVVVSGDTTGTWLTTNGIGVEVAFSLGAGSSRLNTAGSWTASTSEGASGQVNLISTNSSTWYITGVQLELGSQATPFEHRSYGDELARCKRYFERFERQRPGAGSAGTTSLWAGPARSGASNVQGPMHYVEKRNNPTISVSSAGHLNAIYPISPFNAALSGFGIDGNAGTQSAYINATGSGSPGSDCASFVYIGDAAGYLDVDAEL